MNVTFNEIKVVDRADAAGIELGTRMPFVLTSRADNTRTRLASIAVMKLVPHAKLARTAGQTTV